MSCGKRDCKRKARATPSFCRCGVEFCSEACFVAEWHARHQYACPKAVDIKQALAEAKTRPGLPPTKMLVSCALSQKQPEYGADVLGAPMGDSTHTRCPVVPALPLGDALGLPEAKTSGSCLSAPSASSSISPGSSIASASAAPPHEGQQQPQQLPPHQAAGGTAPHRPWTANEHSRSWSIASDAPAPKDSRPRDPVGNSAAAPAQSSWTSTSEAPRSWTSAKCAPGATQIGHSRPESVASSAVPSPEQPSKRPSLDTASDKRKGFKRFNKNDFETVGDPIGSGSYGQVMKVSHTPTGDIYAMKSIPKAKVVEHEMTPYLMREVKTQLTIQHPRMVRLFYYFEDADYVKLLLEYAGGGSLFSVMRKRGRLPERDATRYFLDIAGALNYLHEHKIIHRDLKPENILMCAPNIAKLADFGWCAELAREGAQRNTFCGTWDYLSPEMIQSTPHDFTVDVWATGVLVYEMLTARPPFHHTSQQKAMHRILAVDLQIPDFVSHKARALISALIVLKPENRLNLLDAMQHPWVLSHISEDDVREAVAQAVRRLEQRSAGTSTVADVCVDDHTNTTKLSALKEIDDKATRPTTDASKQRPGGSILTGHTLNSPRKQPHQPCREEDVPKHEQEQAFAREQVRQQEQERERKRDRDRERERALELILTREKEREAERQQEKDHDKTQETLRHQERLQQQQAFVAEQGSKAHSHDARPQESQALSNLKLPPNSSTSVSAQTDAIDETVKRHLAAMRRNLGVEDQPGPSKLDASSQHEKTNPLAATAENKLDTSVRSVPLRDLDTSSRQPWQNTDTFAKLRTWVRKNTSEKMDLVEDLDRTLRTTQREQNSGSAAPGVRADPDDDGTGLSKTVPTVSLGITGFLKSSGSTSQKKVGVDAGGGGALSARRSGSRETAKAVPDSPFDGGFFDGGGASWSKSSASTAAAPRGVVADSPFEGSFFDAAAGFRSDSGGRKHHASASDGVVESPFDGGFFDSATRHLDPLATYGGAGSKGGARPSSLDAEGDALRLRPSGKESPGDEVAGTSTSSPRNVFTGGFLDAPLAPASPAKAIRGGGSSARAAPPLGSAPCIRNDESSLRLTDLKNMLGQITDARTAICNDLDATNRSLRFAFDDGPGTGAMRSNSLAEHESARGSKGWNEINKDLDCMTETFKGQLDKLFLNVGEDSPARPGQKAAPRPLTPTRGLRI